MNKATLNNMGASIMDVAKSIAKDVYPGMPALTEETNRLIQVDGVKKTLDAIFEGTPGVSEQIKKINLRNYDEGIQKVAESVAKETQQPVGAIKDIIDPLVDSAEADVSNLSKPKQALKYAQAYYSNPDKKVRNRRIGATVAAVEATAIGGRFLSGGTLTTDNYGRKDIAGIPFL